MSRYLCQTLRNGMGSMLNHQSLSCTTISYSAMTEHTATIDDGLGRTVRIPLVHEGEFLSAQILIDGVPYHLERIPKSVLGSQYIVDRSEEHTSELQSRGHLVCRRLLDQKTARSR